MQIKLKIKRGGGFGGKVLFWASAERKKGTKNAVQKSFDYPALNRNKWAQQVNKHFSCLISELNSGRTLAFN